MKLLILALSVALVAGDVSHLAKANAGANAGYKYEVPTAGLTAPSAPAGVISTAGSHSSHGPEVIATGSGSSLSGGIAQLDQHQGLAHGHGPISGDASSVSLGANYAQGGANFAQGANFATGFDAPQTHTQFSGFSGLSQVGTQVGEVVVNQKVQVPVRVPVYTQHVQVPVRVPVPVERVVKVPVVKTVQVPYPVVKTIQIPVKIPVVQHVKVPVYKNVPVKVERKVPVYRNVPVVRNVPYHVKVVRPYPVYIRQNVNHGNLGYTSTGSLNQAYSTGAIYGQGASFGQGSTSFGQEASIVDAGASSVASAGATSFGSDATLVGGSTSGASAASFGSGSLDVSGGLSGGVSGGFSAGSSIDSGLSYGSDASYGHGYAHGHGHGHSHGPVVISSGYLVPVRSHSSGSGFGGLGALKAKLGGGHGKGGLLEALLRKFKDW